MAPVQVTTDPKSGMPLMKFYTAFTEADYRSVEGRRLPWRVPFKAGRLVVKAFPYEGYRLKFWCPWCEEWHTGVPGLNDNLCSTSTPYSAGIFLTSFSQNDLKMVREEAEKFLNDYPDRIHDLRESKPLGHEELPRIKCVPWKFRRIDPKTWEKINPKWLYGHMFHCPWCNTWHNHGYGSGYRVPHCYTTASSLHSQQYRIEYMSTQELRSIVKSIRAIKR